MSYVNTIIFSGNEGVNRSKAERMGSGWVMSVGFYFRGEGGVVYISHHGRFWDC